MRKIIGMNQLKKFLEEEENDPVNTGIMIVLVIFCMTILFWLFWALMVYRGGLFEKIIPFISVVFTKKQLADYGYKGWYEQGLFEGWVVNVTAMFFVIMGLWSAVKVLKKRK